MFAETMERRAPERLTDKDWRPSGTTLPAQATLSLGAKSYRVFKCSFPGSEFAMTIVGNLPSQVWPTIERLGELLSLPPNWDTYGAPRIDPGHITAALEFVLGTLRDDTPPPSVVPTSSGSIQLEWHTNNVDLEIEFVTQFRLHVFYRNEITGECLETYVTHDLEPLARAVAALSPPA